MDYRLVFTERALNDLGQVVGRIAEDDEEAAFRFGDGLLNHVDLLTRFPRMAATIAKRSRVRRLVHSPIVVYYRVHDAKHTVEVLHFRHASRRTPKFS